MPETKRSTAIRRLERGGVAAIVAILVGGGVLLGMAALTVDVGNMMWERRQLQNGADATAMTLASACARDVTQCDDDQRAAALTTLASANAYRSATDATAQLDRSVYPDGQCGRVPGAPDLPPCVTTGDIANLGQCTPLPDWMVADSSIPYVETYTLTSDQGSSALRAFFGNPATRVSSCARAVWGSPGSTGITFPLAIRECDWDMATASGADLAPSPPYSPAGSASNNPTENVPAALLPHVTHVIAHATGNAETSCDVGQGASQYAPGGFGWLNDPDDNCSATYNASGVVIGDPGASPSGSCKDLMQNWLGKEVLIPVFTSVSGTGSNTQYTLSGVSAFYFAGWQDLPSAKPNKTYGVYRLPANLGGTSTPLCEIPDDKNPSKYKTASCIWGWFTSPILPVGTVSSSVPPRGPEVIQMIG